MNIIMSDATHNSTRLTGAILLSKSDWLELVVIVLISIYFYEILYSWKVNCFASVIYLLRSILTCRSIAIRAWRLFQTSNRNEICPTRLVKYFDHYQIDKPNARNAFPFSLTIGFYSYFSCIEQTEEEREKELINNLKRKRNRPENINYMTHWAVSIPCTLVICVSSIIAHTWTISFEVAYF